MTQPDEALLWAREELATFWEGLSSVRDADKAVHVANARSGASDNDLEEAVMGRRHWLEGHRAGAAASEARIRALKEALRAWVEKECDYIRRFTLCNPEVQPHVIWSRALLEEDDQ